MGNLQNCESDCQNMGLCTQIYIYIYLFFYLFILIFAQLLREFTANGMWLLCPLVDHFSINF